MADPGIEEGIKSASVSGPASSQQSVSELTYSQLSSSLLYEESMANLS